MKTKTSITAGIRSHWSFQDSCKYTQVLSFGGRYNISGTCPDSAGEWHVSAFFSGLGDGDNDDILNCNGIVKVASC